MDDSGKTLLYCWFGLSSAEFILPVLVTYLFVIYSWRTVWQGIAILVILFLPIVIFNTIKSINLDSREDEKTNLRNIKVKNWKRKEVINSRFSFRILFGLLSLRSSALTISRMWRARMKLVTLLRIWNLPMQER